MHRCDSQLLSPSLPPSLERVIIGNDYMRRQCSRDVRTITFPWTRPRTHTDAFVDARTFAPCPHIAAHTYMHLWTRPKRRQRRLHSWAGTRKVKPIWILLQQETVSGSGISWAICKSAPCSRQTTTPAPYHSVFYRLDALPAAQLTVSKLWRQLKYMYNNAENEFFGFPKVKWLHLDRWGGQICKVFMSIFLRI